MPWITFNGEDIADSQFCIDYLTQKFNVKISDYSAAENAVARAFLKLNEESLLWTIAMFRYIFEQDPSSTGIPDFHYPFLKRMMTYRSKCQGYGLHSQDEGDLSFSLSLCFKKFI